MWSFDEAFKRNRGLITQAEQTKLRESRIAIAGMGGVGGAHLVTLTRLGIGKFTIADADAFEVANFNRQCGATVSTLGRNKAAAMAEIARHINPELDLQVIEEPVDESNVDRFLQGADLFVDGIDAFNIKSRRLVFRKASELGLHAISAGPFGFSTAWVTFAPRGMSFDDYFGLTDSQHDTEQFIKFVVGMAPQATHRTYVDASQVDLVRQCGPSVSAACNLASGVLATEALKLLLRRGQIWTAPYYQQFDPFTGKFARGRLPHGNTSLIQRLKAWHVGRLLTPNH